MKTNFYKTILFILLSIGMLFMYYRVSNLEHKYETLKEANVRLKTNNPLNDAQIKERQFKEETYIRQQERDTTLILFVFSLGSVVIGLFTFRTVKEEFVNQINEVKKEYNDYKTEIEKKHIEISHKYKKLEKDLNFESVATLMNEVRLVKDETVEISLRLSLTQKLIKFLKDSVDDDKAYQESIVDLIDSQIELIVFPFIDKIMPVEEMILDDDRLLYNKRCSVIMNYLNSNSKDELYRKFLLSMSKIKLKEV